MVVKTKNSYSVVQQKNSYSAVQQKTSSEDLFWDRFDKIVCIHYLPYTERFENIKKELKRVGILDRPQFEFYYTIDNDFYKYVLDGIPKEKLDAKRVNLANIKYTIDSFSLLKKLQFYGYEHVLILEDDIVFHEDIDFIKNIVNSTPDDYDVMNYDPEILLLDNELKLSRIDKNILVYDKGKIVDMSCTALSRKAIFSIIEKQKSKLEPFDIYTWLNVANSMNTYCVNLNKNICIQQSECYSNKQTNKTYLQKYVAIDFNNYNTHNDFGKHEKYDVVVSFATYLARIENEEIYQFLKSILNQKCKINYHIVATIYAGDWKKAPSKFKEFLAANNIEVIVPEINLRPHLKYFYSMQKYHNVPAITVDDDMFYNQNLVQKLYNEHVKYPNMIICGRCRKLERDSNGMLCNYDALQLNESIVPDIDNLATGCGGILYPQEFCSLINMSMIDKIQSKGLLTVDDMFLHYLAQKHNIKTKLVQHIGSVPPQGVLVDKRLSSETIAPLYRSNVFEKQNDEGLKILNKKLDAVVSLTSYPHRFTNPEFIKCLHSLATQNTKLNYKIILNLYEPDVACLPQHIAEYIKHNDIELLTCSNNIKQHKKYLNVMKKYGATVPVITVDDDTVYCDNLVEDLFKTHMKNPNRIICGRCQKLERDFLGNVLPYEKWTQEITIPGFKDDDLFGVGVGGILYPVEFCKEIDDWAESASKLIKSDDFLLFIVARTLKIKYMSVETNNKYNRNGGIGFLGQVPLQMHKDEFALWKKNQEEDYKNPCLKYIDAFSSIKELTKEILN